MAVVVSFCMANWCGKALSGVDTYQSRWGGNDGKWGFSSMAGANNPQPIAHLVITITSQIASRWLDHLEQGPALIFSITLDFFSLRLCLEAAILRLSKGKCWWNHKKSWWTKLCTKLDDQNTEFNGLMYVYLLYNLSIDLVHAFKFSNSGQNNLWASLFVRPINHSTWPGGQAPNGNSSWKPHVFQVLLLLFFVSGECFSWSKWSNISPNCESAAVQWPSRPLGWRLIWPNHLIFKFLTHLLKNLQCCWQRLCATYLQDQAVVDSESSLLVSR